jgi:hypothetical protein
MDEHEACGAGQTVPIRVAGRTSGDPLAAAVAGRDGATLEARYWPVPGSGRVDGRNSPY